MLSSSAFSRAALVISLLATFGSCASAPPDPGTPRPGAVAGMIRVSGTHPYERQLVLEGEEDYYWLLRTSALEGELLQLDGQMVRAHGMVGSGPSGSRELSVEWYELLAPPGRIAGVGTLGSQRGALILRCDSAGGEAVSIELLIDGPLREPLGHFIGYRVWVSGDRVIAGVEDGSDSETGTAGTGIAEPSVQAAESERLRVVVMEYGVLGPPTIPLRDVPHSTYPDSCR
jgi:hypothetical protein